MFGYFLSAVYSVAVSALSISSDTAEGKGGGGSILTPARAFHFTRHYCHIA